MKECSFYHSLKDGKVECLLCPHQCVIAEGKRGICRSRVNNDGRLYSECYGKPCSLAIDPIEKKPLYEFLPGTRCLSVACTGCNLRCKNCQNWQISQARPEEQAYYNLSPEALVQLCIDHHLPTIAYTYTEPLTWFEYTLESCQLAHAHDLKNVLVSAGYINPAPLQELAPYLDAANIDLKSLSDDIYREVSGATLAPVLNTLLTLKSAGVWLEITHLLIPPVQDTTHFRRLCQWLRNNNLADCPLHLTRFFPQYKMQHGYSPTPLSFMHEAQAIALEEGIRTVYLGNV